MSIELLNQRIPTYDDLNIDGELTSYYGVYVASDKEIELDLLPTKIVNTSSVMGMDGNSFSSSFFESRVFKLPFYIDDIMELSRFKTLFTKNKPFLMGFENAGLKLKVILTSDFRAKHYGKSGLFELEFEAVDPYFYETYPISVEFTNPTSIEYMNDGNSVSQPMYKVTGQGTVSLLINGEELILKLKDTPETLIINCKTYETYSGTAINRIFDNLSYSFPLLKVGFNTIEVTGNCTKLEIIPNSKWI